MEKLFQDESYTIWLLFSSWIKIEYQDMQGSTLLDLCTFIERTNHYLDDTKKNFIKQKKKYYSQFFVGI